MTAIRRLPSPSPPLALPGRLPQLVPSPPGSVAAEGHTIVGTILCWQDRSGNELRVSGTQLNLEWYTTTMPYCIGGFTIEYRVEPATSPHWGTAATTRIESIRSPQGEVTLTNGAIYYSNGLVRFPFRGSAPDGRKHSYRVRAYNNAGASAWSNEATTGP